MSVSSTLTLGMEVVSNRSAVLEFVFVLLALSFAFLLTKHSFFFHLLNLFPLLFSSFSFLSLSASSLSVTLVEELFFFSGTAGTYCTR